MSNRNPIILVVGAGRIGRSVTRRLHASARFEVKLADPHHSALDWAKRANIRTYQLTAAEYQTNLKAALVGVDVVVCAAPDFVTSDIARAAIESGCHYVDVAESISSKKFIQTIAEHAKSAFVPGCGLAPGFVTTLVSDIASIQGPDSQITAYVGVLPSKKINRMGYANIWGIDGLIAEYTTSCQVIKNGVCNFVEPLTGLESIYFEGQEYEAFNTAGTLDSLVPAMQGKIQGLEFKTLRFPGHLDYIQFLLDDLGLKNNRQKLKSLLRNGLPTVEEDQVIICIENRTSLKSTTTAKTSHRTVIHFQSEDYTDDNGTDMESAVSSISSAHVCTIVDLLCGKGLQNNKGIIHHHNLTLEIIRQSSFFNEIQRCGF